MRAVELALGRGTAYVDDEDYERVSQYRWHFDRGYAKAYYYDRLIGKLRSMYLHRFVLQPLPGQTVDHANGDGLLNTRANLRVCTDQQNAAHQRRKKSGQSQYKGVRRLSSREGRPLSTRWVARITVNYQNIHIGCFATEEEAARAYDEAARRYFGDFAAPNAEMVTHV